MNEINSFDACNRIMQLYDKTTMYSSCYRIVLLVYLKIVTLKIKTTEK